MPEKQDLNSVQLPGRTIQNGVGGRKRNQQLQHSAEKLPFTASVMRLKTYLGGFTDKISQPIYAIFYFCSYEVNSSMLCSPGFL